MRALWVVLGAVVAYFGVGVLLHLVVWPLDPVPPEAGPQVGDVFPSEREGVEVSILERKDDMLRMEVRLQSGAAGPPEHIHLSFEEDFHVISGILTVLLDGKVQQVGPGESLSVPPGAAHKPTNEGSDVAISRHWRPIEHLRWLENALSLSIPQAVLQMSVSEPDVWVPGIPVWLQQGMRFLIAPTARLLGYRNYYPRAES